MKHSITNERYILVGHNIKFSTLFEKIAVALKSTVPLKKIKIWQLELAWRLDWFAGIFGNKRRLFRSTARSAYAQVSYDSSKLKQDLNFTYTPLNDTIQRISKHFNSQ